MRSTQRPNNGHPSKQHYSPRCAVPLVLAAVFFSATAGAQQPQFHGWAQPTQPQRIIYPTPLRDLLFGRQRLVPTGPPVPYYLVPGRVVPPTIVYPREVQPQIVWPAVPAPGGPQP